MFMYVCSHYYGEMTMIRRMLGRCYNFSSDTKTTDAKFLRKVCELCSMKAACECAGQVISCNHSKAT